VVGEAHDGDETVAAVTRLEPDLLLLDLAMPRRTGLEALHMLAARPGKTKILVVTASLANKQVKTALQLGAHGVLLKEAATKTLFAAIAAVMAGRYWVLDEASDTPMPAAKRTGPSAATPFGLSARELDVLRATAMGKSNKEIAVGLDISDQTVKHHLSSIFKKAGVTSRLELIRLSLQIGLVDM
jgi:DNA-binding NarL/FixJ family response regulator